MSRVGPAAESLRHRTREVLRERGLAPRKRHGQNFLVSREIRDRIVAEADLGPGCTVVEVGPGTGLLTEALLATGATVLAVEVDQGLVRLLEDSLGGRPNFRLFREDALRFDFEAALAPYRGGGPIRVVANIPYHITTPLLFRLLAAAGLFDRICLTVQREVADRLAARPGTKAYGALTLACQYLTVARAVLRIPAGAFYPVPAVESALVRLDCRPAPAVTVASEARLFEAIRAAFGQRRKTLRNTLRHAGWPAAAVETALTAAGVTGDRRGETLCLDEFARLSDALPERTGRTDSSRDGGSR
jgi:16S rRNA (adenine1518-N6/adenine1519-N6)-dimethyltransferase